MAKVLLRFIDKETKIVYQPGDIYTGNRVDYLAEKGIVEKAAEKEKVEVKAPKKKKREV